MSVQTRYTQNNGVAVAYETFGDLAGGEPLLLITGLDFQMVWWPDAFCQALADRGFAVVRFDNRDSGLSAKFESARKESPFLALLGRTKPSYTTLDMLDDAIAVMTAAGWTSAHVMGVSMGAALAQAMAVCHPERVRTLICAGGVPADASGVRLMGYIRLGFLAKVRKIKPATTREQEIGNLVEIFRAVASPGYPFPEKWARAAAEVSHDRSPRDPRSTQRQLAAGRAKKIPPISGITVPTLVFCGRDDPIIKPRGSRDIAARIPGATLVIYPGMGRNLPEELWPDFVARISALAGLPSLSASRQQAEVAQALGGFHDRPSHRPGPPGRTRNRWPAASGTAMARRQVRVGHVAHVGDPEAGAAGQASSVQRGLGELQPGARPQGQGGPERG